MRCGSGQAVRQSGCESVVLRDRGGRGGRPEGSRLQHISALQWFSHQPGLLNQGPLSTKTANYARPRCHPTSSLTLSLPLPVSIPPLLSLPLSLFSVLLSTLARSASLSRATVQRENLISSLPIPWFLCDSHSRGGEGGKSPLRGLIFAVVAATAA